VEKVEKEKIVNIVKDLSVLILANNIVVVSSLARIIYHFSNYALMYILTFLSGVILGLVARDLKRTVLYSLIVTICSSLILWATLNLPIFLNVVTGRSLVIAYILGRTSQVIITCLITLILIVSSGLFTVMILGEK